MDWERLTPEDNPPERDTHYYRLHSSEEHMVGTGYPQSDSPETWLGLSYLNDPELDALVTKSEKVRALVKYARMAEWGTGVISKCPECKNYKSEGHTSDCGYVATLAPFKED